MMKKYNILLFIVGCTFVMLSTTVMTVDAQTWGWTVVKDMCAGIINPCISWKSILQEIKQLISDPFKYIRSFWNIVEFLVYLGVSIHFHLMVVSIATSSKTYYN